MSRSSTLAKLIIVEPASILVPEGYVHEQVHEHDRTRNDSAFIDLATVVVRVGWDIDVGDPPDFDLAKQSGHVVKTVVEVGRQSFGT